jgi:hypothetical protein
MKLRAKLESDPRGADYPTTARGDRPRVFNESCQEGLFEMLGVGYEVLLEEGQRRDR